MLVRMVTSKPWRLIWEPADGTRAHQLGHRRRHMTFRTWEAALAYARKLEDQGVMGKPRIEKTTRREPAT